MVDYPAVVPPASAERNTQLLLSRYLDALAPLAERSELVLDDAAFVQLAAGNAPGLQLAAVLGAARDGNAKPPPPLIGPNPPQVPDDWRLEAVVRQADAPVQALLAQLADAVARLPNSGAADPAELAEARGNYRGALARIGAGHALLRQRAAHLDQEETRRMMRREEDALRRIAARLPTATPTPRPA